MEQPRSDESRQERSSRLNRVVRSDMIAACNLILGHYRAYRRWAQQAILHAETRRHLRTHRGVRSPWEMRHTSETHTEN